MTDEPNNLTRAAWAAEALVVFTARTYCGDHPDDMHRGDLETAIGDLITDLLHLACVRGFDARDLARHAIDHFEAERYEEARR